jgi:subtilase family serine protease
MKFFYTDTYGNLLMKRRNQPQPEEPRVKTFYQPYTTPNVSTKINTPVSFPPQYFSGSQLRNLYNVPTVNIAGSAKKVTIAIIVAFTYPGLKADLLTYWQNPINFGANSVPPTINIYTTPGATQNKGWAQEECLDVQMACTINPNANIWVVEAKSDSFTDLKNAITYATNTLKADILSMSWGSNESPSLTQYNSLFTNTAICYCAASGDTNSVSWPATSANCVAVGGTSLIWSPTTTPNRTEYVWNSAGCGYSSIIPQPNYQFGISTITHANRVIPDLAMVADSNTSVYTVYNGYWYGVGGTSVSAPIFAGVLSLANQMRFNAGKRALTSVYTTTPNVATNASYVAPANHLQTYLYKTVYPNNALYSSIFYDITVGNNSGSIGGTSTGMTIYNTDAKFDVATGLGSPNASNFCNVLMNV